MSRPCALRGDKADLLFFNQAARAKLFSPIKFFDAVIKEANIMPLHAYTSLLHAVKTGQPHVSVGVTGCKSTIYFLLRRVFSDF